MKRTLVLFLIFLFSFNFVFGDEWGSINDGSDVPVEDVVENTSNDALQDFDSEIDPVVDPVAEEKSFVSGEVYTIYFYIALGVGFIGVLIIGAFFYFFLKKPKDKWSNSKVVK